MFYHFLSFFLLLFSPVDSKVQSRHSIKEGQKVLEENYNDSKELNQVLVLYPNRHSETPEDVVVSIRLQG